MEAAIPIPGTAGDAIGVQAVVRGPARRLLSETAVVSVEADPSTLVLTEIMAATVTPGCSASVAFYFEILNTSPSTVFSLDGSA